MDDTEDKDRPVTDQMMYAAPGSLAKRDATIWTSWLMFGATNLFAFGVLLPTVETKAFFLFSSVHSILGFTFKLLGSGELFFGGIILLFSVVFPYAKLIALWRLYAGPPRAVSRKKLRRMERLAKWSMLDVFVVALTVFAVKTSGLGSALALPGLYVFAAAVFVSMIVTGRVTAAVEADLDRREAEASEPAARFVQPKGQPRPA